ncbi:MAG: hypothetical protein CMJ64_30260 [Planctomycetaceae bacterium]|nr:hypothetical protein [Planctomycetaceae bacterium]
MRILTLLPALILFTGIVSTLASEPTNERLLIAFASLRAEPLHPTIYFYEHDGKAAGKIVGKIVPGDKRSDHHPSLSQDGRLCAFAAEVVSTVCTVECWNRDTEKSLTLTPLNKSPNAQMAPSFGAASVVCVEAWNRPGSPGRWDLLLYHCEKNIFLESPNLNTSQFDERKPTLSGDGRWLAFTTNSHADQRLSEIALYDRAAGQLVSVPNLNSQFMESEPSISHDGRCIAFVTDRLGGQGARDISLYDRQTSQMVALPGLNSVGQEQSPSLSPDGRFIAFVSERLEGTGERDIYVYDRDTKSLLPLPALNSPRDEYDPCVIGLSSAMD